MPFYRTGIPQIDREHREMLVYLSSVTELDHPELEYMAEYMQGHIEREEALMRGVKYPEAKVLAHKADHDRLRDIFLKRYDPQEMAKELKAHILKFDAELGDWISTKRT